MPVPLWSRLRFRLLWSVSNLDSDSRKYWNHITLRRDEVNLTRMNSLLHRPSARLSSLPPHRLPLTARSVAVGLVSASARVATNGRCVGRLGGAGCACLPSFAYLSPSLCPPFTIIAIFQPPIQPSRRARYCLFQVLETAGEGAEPGGFLPGSPPPVSE